ncbi:UDP-N-acetylmuramate dehydrogenase [Candidatus Gracilibacteria bacterium]|nr:UDP-N-acetylmuramate dehydrogenase [Candidatus Gracilibacteria bacterium]
MLLMIIQENISLKNYNTLGIEAKAKFFVVIKSEEELVELLDNKIWIENKRFILGGGANTLFKSDFDGLVVKNEMMGKEIIKEEGNDVQVRIGAGEDWPEFVDWCVEKNIGGIENLAMIPGCVGASPIGNIGAYGVEVKDLIESVEGINLESKEKKIYKNSECKFGYRDSIFKNELKDKFVVTGVIWKLKIANENYELNINYSDIKRKIDESNINIANLSVKDIAAMIRDIRNNKLPDWKVIGTAGSFFKNPVVNKSEFEKLKEKYDNLLGFDFEDKIKLSAGQLIEMAGFKGMKVGNAGTYQYHALIIINEGGSGQEVMEFASSIQSKVKEMFGVDLEPEVNYV